MTTSPMIRAFLAIDPPPPVLQHIVSLQDALKKSLPQGVRWVRPDGIHLTLKFLGNLFPSNQSDIESILPEIVGRHRVFDLTACRVGVFPGPAKPRIIWVGITGETAVLSSLQEDIEAALETIGFSRENRPFRAHLTLGRIRDPRSVAAGAERMIAGGRVFETSPFTVERVLFIKSDLTPKGAIYTPLMSFPLAPRD